MRDDERRAPLHDALQSALHEHLVFCIECARGLVEQQDRRILQDGTCNGKPLALAARQRDAALTQAGLIAFWQSANEGIGLGGLGGGLDVGHACIRGAIGDVGGNGVGKERDILRHESNALAQHVKIGLAHIDPVDHHAPRLGIEEPQQHGKQRRLAGTGRADDGDRLARRHAQGELVERMGVRPGGIGEGHGLERDLTLGRDRQRLRIVRRADLRHLGQEFAQALGGACGLAYFTPDLGKLSHGASREQGIENELAKAATGHLARNDGGCAEPQHRGDRCDDEKNGHGGQASAGLEAAACAFEGLLDGTAEAARDRSLVGECLHGADGNEVLAGVGGGFGQRVLCFTRQAAHDAPITDQRQHDRGYREQHHRRQARTGHEHHDQRADQHDGVAQCLAEGGARGCLDLCRVGGEAAHHLAGMGALEESRSQVRQVLEHICTQIGDDAFAQPVDEVEARGAGNGQDRSDDDQHAEILVDELTIGGAEAEVDHAPDGQRHHEHRACRDHERHQSRRQHALVL